MGVYNNQFMNLVRSEYPSVDSSPMEIQKAGIAVHDSFDQFGGSDKNACGIYVLLLVTDLALKVAVHTALGQSSDVEKSIQLIRESVTPTFEDGKLFRLTPDQATQRLKGQTKRLANLVREKVGSSQNFPDLISVLNLALQIIHEHPTWFEGALGQRAEAIKDQEAYRRDVQGTAAEWRELDLELAREKAVLDEEFPALAGTLSLPTSPGGPVISRYP